MMTDSEMRAVILRKFYELRHTNRVVQLPEIAALQPGAEIQIANVCEQLNEHGLIEWKPIRALTGTVGGLGKITAHGVDVIEGNAQTEVKLVFHDESISISGSSNIQIGDSNIQTGNLEIGKLISAVDHSNASEAEKNEAKSLLRRLAENKLVVAVLTALLTGGGSAH
jgi:hypothetical protein